MSILKYIYGPVLSRRMGLSLGIDLVPKKTCTFNCIYCQVGATQRYTTKRGEYVPADEVITEFEQWLELGQNTDWVTFSGNGEPTLHSDIGYIINEVKRLSPFPVAVITNSSTLNGPGVRDELKTADLLIPTLEAAEQELFERINRPAPGILVIDVIVGLLEMRELMQGEMWLEILLVEGLNDNYEALSLLAKAVTMIQPHRVQLHTIERPPTETSARPLNQVRIREIADTYFPNADVTPYRTSADTLTGSRDLREVALETAGRRPLSAEGLVAATGVDINIAVKVLALLEHEGLLRSRGDGIGAFYITNTDK